MHSVHHAKLCAPLGSVSRHAKPIHFARALGPVESVGKTTQRFALGIGAAGEMQQPLALAVVGGLAVSTLATLFVLPAFAAGKAIAPPAPAGTERSSS